MNLRALQAVPSADLARALAGFETQFKYPLGPCRSFRISHGSDYSRFFRAMGEGVCFVADREGQVLGTIGAAIRPLLWPEGHERRVLYLGDLKVAAAARGGRCLVKLVSAVRRWAGSKVDAAVSVVMDGTSATPIEYTGRFEIPTFRKLGTIMILRIGTTPSPNIRRDAWQTSQDYGAACYRELSASRYASLGGNPAERSVTEPLWLTEPSGLACGRFEDTRKAKRLIGDDGVEMRSAHLSNFAFRDPRAAVDLLRVSLSIANEKGFPTLFTAVAEPDVEVFRPCMEGTEVVLAPATIYGTGVEPWPLWNINTSEI